MTKIAHTSPDGLTLLDVITSRQGLVAIDPEQGWFRDLSKYSDEIFIAAGYPLRMVTETAPPEIEEFGERAEPSYVRQPDGTWLEEWSIVETITLAVAKAQLARMAIEIYWSKVQIEQPSVAEMTTHNADPAPIVAARVTKFRPTLVSVRNAIQNATTVAECWALYKQIRDAA